MTVGSSTEVLFICPLGLPMSKPSIFCLRSIKPVTFLRGAFATLCALIEYFYLIQPTRVADI